MSIVVTPIPRLTTLVAPSFTLGTANAAGAALTAVPSNSTILTYDTTDPASVAGAAVVGDATTAARRNHVHNIADVSATEAQMQTATATTVFPTAATTQNHPGVAKVYCYFIADGTLQSGSYNVASVTKNSTGVYTIAWDTDFADTNYVPIGLVDGSDLADLQWSTFATGSLVVNTFVNDTAYDRRTWVVAFGEQ
jgi:hypothetical protein